MSVTKTTQTRGAMLAMETTSYGSGTPALSTSTDGFKTYEPFEVQIGYLNEGKRDGNPGTGMQGLSPVGANGRKGMVDLVHYYKGAGAGYSASVRATIDKILRGFGMSAAITGGAGTEVCTYSPILVDTSLCSLVAELYSRKQKYNLKGAYVSKIVIESKGLVVPKITASLAGIMAAAPTDASVPAITYPGSSLKNPKSSAIGLAFTTGGQTYTPKLREWTLTLERELAERSSQNEANGDHPGHMLGDLKATLEALWEATNVVTGSPFASASAFDPYRVFENAGDISWGLTIAGGGGQYNRLKINAPRSNLVGAPTEDKEGPLALWGTTMEMNPTTEESFDPLTVVTD